MTREDPTRVVVAAYGLAILSFLLPFAAIGGLFAGIALIRRGRPADGWGVLVVTALATVLGILILH